MSLKNKLNRLKPHLSTKSGQDAESGVKNPIAADTYIPFMEEWEKAGVKPYLFDGQYCLIREVIYPLGQRHGHYRFSDFLKAVELWEETGIDHPLSSSGHSPGDLFFFDTETTGLGGGAGNTIFLLGYASVAGGNFILRQHILPHPGAEVPLYQSFLENIDYRTLVTYNGKSFDWPQVKTRHTLVRDHVPKLPAFGHFDLYHAAKRLWKHKLERMKLSVVEKEVLGVERVDDIPGFLAPMIFFDFAESGRPDGMLGILKHNEVDILSLVTLYTHLTFQLSGMDGGRTKEETFEVGKWFQSVGNHSQAVKAFAELAEGKGESSIKSKLALGYLLKKEKKWREALDLFCAVAEAKDSTLSLEACIEAAKILEHQYRDYDQARIYSRNACDLCRSEKMKTTQGTILKEDILRRDYRIRRKSSS